MFVSANLLAQTPQTLPFSQNWNDTSLIKVNDDWSGVAGIVGYRGDSLTIATGVDPQTVLDGDATPEIDVNANLVNPNTFISGGVAEFEITDPVVALQGSGTADAPYLLISIITTGKENIQVSYNLRDIDGSADNAIQQVALQYRIGNTGDFTNVPAAYVADASTGPSLADLVTPVSVTLPSDVNDKAEVQIRIITTNAVGNDEFIGVDDISITGSDISSVTYLLDEDFESITNSGDPIAGWTFNNAQTWNLSDLGHNSDKYAGWYETTEVDHSITSPLVTNPGTLSFWIAAYNDQSNLQVKVQYSANGSDWTDAATFTSAGAGGDFGLSFFEKTVPLQLTGDYYIRWTTFNYVSGGFYIDDILLDDLVPVELTSFAANVSDKNVLLNWTTATELNNSGFDIERKSASTNWQKIAFVQGNGTTTQPKSYSFTDRNLADGKYSYRLKQIDYDGTYEYSKIVEVRIASAVVNEFELSQNYPNPFNPTTTIKFNIPDAGNVKLSVYNLLGQEIQTLVNGFMESGSHSVNFDASNLNSGIYLYKLEANGFNQTRKMTLIK